MPVSQSGDPPRKRQLKFLVLGAAGAGKTSLLRRYFYKQFDHERMPTVGSDFYVGKVQHSTNSACGPLPSNGYSNPTTDAALVTTVNIQMWDTPGKENFALHRQQQHTVHYSATLSDSFFQHADAIMLVYDMTSSTSFTRLLKWYGDLMELFVKTSKPVPILIVANKLDLFQEHPLGAAVRGNTVQQRVPQRNVMGFTGEYYGQHFHYEYQISPETSNKINTVNMPPLPPIIDPLRKFNKGHVEISSYLVNRDNWTTDGSYLDSLLHSEDESHPDRELVLLWCRRNGLTMVEMSAATGEGVDDAIAALLSLALNQPAQQPQPTIESSALATKEQVNQLQTFNETELGLGQSSVLAVSYEVSREYGHARTKASEQALYVMGRSNEELDLHQRYAKEENKCFSLIPSLRHCLKR